MAKDVSKRNEMQTLETETLTSSKISTPNGMMLAKGIKEKEQLVRIGSLDRISFLDLTSGSVCSVLRLSVFGALMSHLILSFSTLLLRNLNCMFFANFSLLHLNIKIYIYKVKLQIEMLYNRKNFIYFAG